MTIRRQFPNAVRVIAFVIAVALLVAGGVSFAANPVKLVVDGREIACDVAPQIVDGRVMVPVRFVAEALGCKVEWDADSRTVKITSQKAQLAQEDKYAIRSARDALVWGLLYTKVPEGAYAVPVDKMTPEQLREQETYLKDKIRELRRWTPSDARLLPLQDALEAALEQELVILAFYQLRPDPESRERAKMRLVEHYAELRKAIDSVYRELLKLEAYFGDWAYQEAWSVKRQWEWLLVDWTP